MQVDLEAVFEEAQRSLFTQAWMQRKSGEFPVNGVLIYFKRRSHEEVTVWVDGETLDIPRID